MKKLNVKLNPDLIFDALGTLGGLLSVLKSFTIHAASTGSFESALKYGGDAYTGMQNASAQTANNVLAGNRILVSFAATILLAVGLALIAHFGKKLFASLTAAKAETAATVVIQTEETEVTETTEA